MPTAEYDVTVTFTVRVAADTIADAQVQVGDRIRSAFFGGEDRGAISAMDTTRVTPLGSTEDGAR